MTELARWRERLSQLRADYDYAVRTVKEEKRAVREASRKTADALAAQAVLQRVAAGVQKAAHERLAAVVTRCIKAIFGDDAYSFQIDFQQKRGKTEAVLTFVDKDGNVLSDPKNSAGVGVVEVAALALRLVSILLARPPKRRLLVLDEPCKFLNGAQYQERVGALLTQLSEEMGMQIILVADDDWLRIGKVIQL